MLMHIHVENNRGVTAKQKQELVIDTLLHNRRLVLTCAEKLQSLRCPAGQVISISLQQRSFFPSWTPTYHCQGSSTQDPVILFPISPRGLGFLKGEESQVQSRGEDGGVT